MNLQQCFFAAAILIMFQCTFTYYHWISLYQVAPVGAREFSDIDSGQVKIRLSNTSMQDDGLQNLSHLFPHFSCTSPRQEVIMYIQKL
jgi:hypothetical protein